MPTTAPMKDIIIILFGILGSVLQKDGKYLARAVSELRLATQQPPEHSPAHFYLGKALRALVEQEILTEAEKAFQNYLEAGAPLGQQEEIQTFLQSRKNTTDTP